MPATATGVSATQAQPPAPHREGELLVRFRTGVSNRDKETILATQGARKKKNLRGESGVEKFELTGGRDARAAAVQFLMNPQVEFAEPNFLIGKDDVLPTIVSSTNSGRCATRARTAGSLDRM